MSKLYIDNPPQEIIDFLNSRSNFTGIAKDTSKVSILSIINDITSFLPSNCKFAQRKYHILNKTGDIPKCAVCEKNAVWSYKSINYSRWCSGICKNKDPYFKKKIKDTFVEKYGTESFTSSEVFREKYKKHMQITYGVNHYLQNPIKLNDIQAKRETLTGYKSPVQDPDIIKKIQATNILKYNVNYPLESSEIRKKTDNSLLNNYGVYRHNLAKFSNDTNSKLNDQAWLYEQNSTHNKTLTQIGYELEGYSSPAMSARFKRLGIPVKLNSGSITQDILIEYISSYVSIVSNNRDIIHPYELDIYIPSHKLAIEYCGLYWHNELKKPHNYHKMKYDMCKKKGIRLLTIFEDEWLYKEELIKGKLKHILGISDQNKIYARKTDIREIFHQDKKDFLNINHIQGDGPSSINLGLYYNDELIACMGMLLDANKTHYNLSRYATSKNVVGGFSKLLTYFEKQYKPTQIYTFADLRWSQGDLYYKNGFVLDKILRPDYTYIVNNERIHKFNFRHKQLAKKMENYDPQLSEHQNCLNNKIYRIYDCGKLRFVKKY